jgi:hypothetical protein
MSPFTYPAHQHVRRHGPRVPKWLAEGVKIEAHTVAHPCPCPQGGDFAKAKRTDEEGRPRFKKYSPRDRNFVNYVERWIWSQPARVQLADASVMPPSKPATAFRASSASSPVAVKTSSVP